MPKKPPLISVVMSVYNGEKYLQDAVDSILQQTFPDFEFLIINDGSTDSTSKMLEEFSKRDNRIKTIENEHNIGLTSSLNKGIMMAEGKYIARMDADDLSLSSRLEKQLEFLEQNPSHIAVGSSFYQIDDKSKITSFVSVLSDDKKIKNCLKSQNWLCHGSVLMRKDIFWECGGYDERFKYSQDYDLWLRMSERFRLSNIPEPLYYWRATLKAISKSNETDQKHDARLAVTEAENRRCTEITSKGHPFVSVIVPTYNRPEMLKGTIESILSQTYKNFEIIIVNDNGVEVKDIVNNLNTNNKIRYFKHAQNEGLASARNTGILMSKGTHIAYLDDDDIFYPEHLETLVDFLMNNNFKIAYTDAYCRHLKKNGDSFEIINKDVPYSSDFDKRRFLFENYIPVLCFLQEKECLLDENLFDPKLKRTEDWDLWIRLSRKWEFAHIKKITCEFSIYEDKDVSMSGRMEPFSWAALNMFYKYRVYAQNYPGIPMIQKKIINDALSLLKKTIQNSVGENAEKIILNSFDEPNIENIIKRLKLLVKQYKEFESDIYYLIALLCFKKREIDELVVGNAADSCYVKRFNFHELIEHQSSTSLSPSIIKDDNINLIGEVAALHSETASFYGEIVSLNKELENLRVDMPALLGENKALHNEITRIKSSMSWHITKPLRLMSFMLRWITRDER